MTRIAPVLTLVAVAVLGAGLLATNYLSTPVPPVPLAAITPEVPAIPEPAAVTGTVPAPVEAPATPSNGTAYAGWTSGMGLTVAMAVTGEDVVAYVCNGADVEVWLRGSLTDGELDLESTDGDTLTGTADASSAEGTVTLDGAQWSFTAEPIDADAAAAAGRGDVAEVAERAGMDY